jgi:hypothetical protein
MERKQEEACEGGQPKEQLQLVCFTLIIDDIVMPDGRFICFQRQDITG